MAGTSQPSRSRRSLREQAIAPGWRAVQTGELAFVLDGEGRHVATIHGNPEERMARARLIAAAPDLLDATMALITTFGTIDAHSAGGDTGRRLGEFADPRLMHLTNDQLLEQADANFRAALAAIVRAISGDAEISEPEDPAE